MKSAKLPAPLLSNEGTEFQSYWGPHLAFGSNWGHPSLFSSLEQVKKKRSPLFKWVPSHHSLLYCPSPRFFIFIIFYCFLSDMLGMPNYLCKSVFSWSTKSFIVFHPPPLFLRTSAPACPCDHVLSVITVIFSFDSSLLSLTCVNRLYSHRSQPLFQDFLLVIQILVPYLDGQRANHI